MRSTILALLLSLLPLLTFAQDTLQNYDPNTTNAVADTFPSQGYYTGHNDYGDEEFAEKYELVGSANIVAIIAIHQGVAGTSSKNASYKLYSVGTNGLPDTVLGTKTVAYNNIPIDGSEYTVTFATPVMVSEDFFVSLNLGDYVHGNAGTKKIALTHSPDGTRDSADFNVFGRNAIRWHSHGSPNWKDYRTENFSGYQPAVHFSIFPVVEMAASSVIGFDDQTSIGAIFPNPSAHGSFTIPIETKVGGKVSFQLLDLSGRIVAEDHAILNPGQTDYQFLYNELAAGSYYMLIKTPEGSISQQVLIR